MAFVNEYIPAADMEKYNFAALNKRPANGGDQSRHWTIDREADLVAYTAADGGYTGVSAWDYYWKGHLILVELYASRFTQFSESD